MLYPIGQRGKGDSLNKQEALDLLHEIHDACKDAVSIHAVSLDYRNSQVSKDPDNRGYLIRMKAELDDYAKSCINPILEKHQLAIKEDKGYLVIFKMHFQN
jgi:hypothetical protein